MPPTSAPAAMPAVTVHGLTHRYGNRVAVDALDFETERGTITALLGPNGSGKSTLFRVLSTLARPQVGTVAIDGLDVTEHLDAVRKKLGVVFQFPSLDKKLTVEENLRHQAHLYGMPKAAAREKIEALTGTFGLQDRLRHRVETLSGGLQRRVELAKALLHDPEILLLDEPSTGLDPGARADLRETLLRLRETQGATVLLTTHLIEEADFADRVIIMHEGKIVADGTPHALRSEVGGDVITLRGGDLQELLVWLHVEHGLEPMQSGLEVRLQTAKTAEVVPLLLPVLGDKFYELTLGRPTLEDLFFARTGRKLGEEPAEPTPSKKGGH